MKAVVVAVAVIVICYASVSAAQKVELKGTPEFERCMTRCKSTDTESDSTCFTQCTEEERKRFEAKLEAAIAKCRSVCKSGTLTGAKLKDCLEDCDEMYTLPKDTKVNAAAGKNGKSTAQVKADVAGASVSVGV